MPATSVVIFLVDRIRCAIPAHDVVELARAVAIAPLPGAPEVVAGLITHRGAVLPVFDLARRFTGRVRDAELHDVLLVVDAGARRVALLADALEGVADVEWTLESPPVSVSEPSLPGVLRTADGVLLVHEPLTFLTDLESWALDDAVRASLTPASTT